MKIKNSVLGAQRQSRERLSLAALRWAALTEAANNPVHEQLAGEVVNRGGHTLRVTVYVHAERVPE